MNSNQKYNGNSKSSSNFGTDRAGKQHEKRDVKSILKGSRGNTKTSNDKLSYGYKHRFGNKLQNNEESRIQEDRNSDKLEFKKRDDSRSVFSERSFYEKRDSKPSFGDKKPLLNKDRKSTYAVKKPYENRDGKPIFRDRPFKKSYELDVEKNHNEKLTLKKASDIVPKEYVETRFDNKKEGIVFRKPLHSRRDNNYDSNAKYSKKKQDEFQKTLVDHTKPIRLNKFLANAGICSRREADEYIQAGVITVNGAVVSELGVKVLHTDNVMFHNQLIRSEKKVYILLNKPKDCVTTSEDTHERLTVIDLVKNACSERIYPVGRLDRNTTGVILLTNDGDLASKLTHPKYNKKKIYHVALDKPLVKDDYDQIMVGITLDDGVIAADSLEFVKADDLKQVGIEIHSGQNRVIRRIFEKLGYKVIRLDRVYFSGLTKKSLARGKYRFLNEREINMLKMGAYD